MNELIKKLKHNEKPFGLLRESEQGEMQACRKTGGVEWYGPHGGWTSAGGGECQQETTYRIRADYQPKPEVERCEVFTKHLIDGLDLRYKRAKDDREAIIWRAVSDPDFIEFQAWKDGAVIFSGVFITWVATRIFEGYKVYALFRAAK